MNLKLDNPAPNRSIRVLRAITGLTLDELSTESTVPVDRIIEIESEVTDTYLEEYCRLIFAMDRFLPEKYFDDAL